MGTSTTWRPKEFSSQLGTLSWTFRPPSHPMSSQSTSSRPTTRSSPRRSTHHCTMKSSRLRTHPISSPVVQHRTPLVLLRLSSRFPRQSSTFMLFDTRGDGMIPNTKVGEVLRALGTNPTEAEVHRLCQDYMKKDDRISFDTFLPILQTVS